MLKNVQVSHGKRMGILTLILLHFFSLSLTSSTYGQTPQTPQGGQGGSGTAPSLKEFLSVSASLVAPKTVSDVFGKRIATRYFALQLTIANRNRDFQFLIHDVVLNLDDVFVNKSLAPLVSYKPTSEDLLLLRGVAEKGQIYDKRNLVIRLMRAAGSIGAGLIGVTTFGSSYAPSVAVFNGPLITAISQAFPDMTINQLNRLNDSAYAANTLVPKQSSKVVVAFLPQAIIMDSKLRGAFWKDPTSIMDQIDFRNVEAFVDGSFIMEITAQPPVITKVQISDAEMAKFAEAKPEVKGEVRGRFLSGSTLSVEGASDLSIAIEGTPEDNAIQFKLTSEKPVPEGTTVQFTATKEKAKTTFAMPPLQYKSDPPSVTDMDPKELTQGTSTKVTITGSNFVPNDSQIIISPDQLVEGSLPVQRGQPDVKGPDKIEVTLKVAKKAVVGEYRLRVMTSNGASGEATFKVKASQ